MPDPVPEPLLALCARLEAAANAAGGDCWILHVSPGAILRLTSALRAALGLRTVAAAVLEPDERDQTCVLVSVEKLNRLRAALLAEGPTP